jgi:pimeloyl-ACP methyl ester carboxylesterase
VAGPWTHRSVSANGIRLHVAEAGPADGPLVLLLHGFPSFWWSWRHQLPALAAAGHRVVAADLRGYGGSDRPPRGYDLWTLAGDVTGLVRALGARQAAVVGAGWGGAIGWTAATLYPAAVSRLAVLGAPHPLALRRRPPRRALGTVLGFQLPRLPERSLRRDGSARVDALLRAGSGPAWTQAPEFDEVADRHRAAMGVPRVSHCALEYFRWAVRSQLRPDGRRFAAAVDRPVERPVLQLHGAVDPWTPPSLARASARWCAAPPALRVLDEVGHFPHQEAPQHVTDALLDFLAR